MKPPRWLFVAYLAVPLAVLALCLWVGLIRH